jgi:hypothetical protein
MAWVAVAVPEQPSETITLYLDLEPNRKADFEVVGRVAAAFAETVKEVAYIIAPDLEVKLEFESGEPGSLKLNAILKDAKKKGKKATLIIIILTVAGWFFQDLRTYGVSKFLDSYLPAEQKKQLSDDDIDRIAKRLKDVMDGKIAKEPAQEVYRELERDSAIKSVGTTPSKDTRPVQPVPRIEFPIRAGIVPQIETTPKKRTKHTTERLTLISPVLLESNRIWRFHSPAGEFGYVVKDEKFLKSLLTGRRRIPMKKGIQITAKIETREELEGGVWVIKERSIIEVVRVHRAPTSDLFSEPKKGKRRKK